MNSRFHLTFLCIPLVLWGIWFGMNTVGQARINSYFKKVDGMIWNFDKTTITAESNHLRKGEIEQFTIRIINNKNHVMYDDTILIDWDMGGGGFLKGMQTDDDPEFEIVCVKKGSDRNFYLDISSTEVGIKDFKAASPGARSLAEKWLAYHAPNPFSLGFWLIITILYYVLYYPVSLIFKIFKKFIKK